MPTRNKAKGIRQKIRGRGVAIRGERLSPFMMTGTGNPDVSWNLLGMTAS